MTHDYLVKRAAKWLENRYGTYTDYRPGCSPVFAEKGCAWVSEEPDAIGWRHAGSYLIECKISQGDFYSDKRKLFRKRPEMGMGRFRYYMVPSILVSWGEDRLPHSWGLLSVSEKQVHVIKQAEPQEYSLRREVLFLRSAFYKLKVTEPPTDDILAAHKELQVDMFPQPEGGKL